MKSQSHLNAGRQRFDSLPAFAFFLFLGFVSFRLDAQEPASEDSIMTVTLDEVVVTATRGGGEMLRLPMAVSVVGARDFFASRRAGLNDALWAMPGVLVQSRAGGQDVRLTVRGFGARGSGDRSNAATVRGIKVLVDGFPETEPDGRTALDVVDLHAIQRIEVVRSNASTLFGNASGGVINIETMPWFTEPFGETSHLFGAYGLRKNNVNIGMPVGRGRTFVSATNSAWEGYRKHSSSQTTTIHATLAAELDESTRLRLSFAGASNRFNIPGPLTEAQFHADPTQANPTYAARRERRFNRTARFGVQVNKELGDEHSFELLGYLTPKILERSERGTYRDFNRLHAGGGLIYHWHSGSDGLLRRITAGFDGSTQDGTILFYSLVDGERGDSLRTNKREAAATSGVFLQAELQLLDRLLLTLGARFDRQIYVSQDFAAGARSQGKRDELSLGHSTPKAALLYLFSSNHSFYVTLSGGVEAPAFNEVDPPPTLPNVSLNPLLKPMSSTTMEIGVKGVEQFGPSAFVRLVSYSAAAYRITVRDEIVPYNGGAWFFSAGSSQRHGFELGGQLDLRGGWSVKSALTYLNAQYQAYRNDVGDFSGKEVPGIAPFVWNTRARYGTSEGFFAELGLEHVGSYFADDANTLALPSYSILHGAMGYSFRVGALKISSLVGVNNLTNEHYGASAFINPAASGIPPTPAYIEPGLPANVFGSLHVQAEL